MITPKLALVPFVHTSNYKDKDHSALLWSQDVALRKVYIESTPKIN